MSSLQPDPTLVQSVEKTGGNTANWTFSSNVTVLGSSPVGFQIEQATGTWVGASSSSQIAANIISLFFSGGVTFGHAWRIIVPPTQVTNPERILVPQYGLIA